MNRSWTLFGWMLLALSAIAQAQTFSVFSTNATWQYFKGTSEASGPDVQAWRQRTFADGAWPTGAAPFSYGEIYLTNGVQLTDMQNRYTTLYLRRSFVITNASEIEQLELTAACDDGYLAWINGTNVVSYNAPPGEPLFNAVAPAALTEPVPFLGNPIVNPGDFLVSGINVLAVQVFNVSPGSSDLVFDAELTATLKPRPDPLVIRVSPQPDSALTSLTQITVTFSKPVAGVDAGDLMVNEIPCTGLTGRDDTYTFTFEPPAYGTVQASWNMRCGITDLSVPAVPFNPTGPGARWVYELYDPSAPKLASLNPPAGTALRQLRQVEVYFDRPVTGVDAADLRVNGAPATNVTGVAAGAYVFEFPAVAPGIVQVAWADAPGIVDLSPEAHAFVGEDWSYTVDPRLAGPDLIINEFMAENVGGIKDEDGDCEDWIELYNRGSAPVNLAGWSLTDDARLPGQWVLPAVTLPSRQYLMVFASGKDRRPTTAGAKLHTNFKLGVAGEYLGLYNAESPRVAVSEFAPQFPEQRNDCAFGLDWLGRWRYFLNGTPGAANGVSGITNLVEPVHFSVQRGFFQKPFNLSLATPTPGAAIRYTLDGSAPTLTNGLPYTNLLTITSTRIVRAAAFRTDRLPSKVMTHTYLYNVSASRRLLPALSLVTASNHLYGKSGIMEYSPRNTWGHGIAWERPVSAEWIRPEDNGGFHVDCGIRIQGGGYIRGVYNYRSSNVPDNKYSFRLYFRGDYGAGRLNYPLFPEVPVDSFDTLILRAGMNDPTNPFLRDEFVRRLEADVGQVSARGTFVNLFLNGVYKGYYNPAERIDPDFLQTWHGGTNAWDLIAMGGEIREGDAMAWNALRNYASTNNLALPDKYLEMERRLDLTNFVEYLIPLVYADTDDWPHNNWRSARERSPQALFRFYCWDAEWSVGGSGAVSHNTIAGQLSNLSPPWGGTEIQSLFLRLKASPEFRLLFADRVHKHFFNGGAMTDERIKARYEWLKAQIAPSISGFDNSIGTSWIPSRRRYLTNHFNLAGFLASSNAPVLNQFGGRVPAGFNLTLSNGVGAIYYTTNGSDPRVRFTGAVAPDARAYTPGAPLVLDRSTPLRARSQWGTNWSALTEATFQVEEFGMPLRLTEVMYNPPGGDAYEFVELQNLSALPIALSGVHFEGIEFRFAQGTVVAGGARLTLISDANPTAFAKRYPGVAVFGQYQGSLSNKGEKIALVDAANRRIASVTYADSGAWPVAADGGGRSLEIINPSGDPDDPANWRASAQPGGSPGAPNPPPPAPLVRLNEIAAGANALAALPESQTSDWCELLNPGPAAVELAGWTLSDGSADRQFVFPTMTLAAGDYLIVHCDTNALPEGLHAGFGLPHGGDHLFLRNAQGEAVDAIAFGPQAPGFTIGRVGDGSVWGLTEPTPGAPNAAATLGSPSSCLINEVLANAIPGGDDWLELFNTDPNRPVALQGISLGASNVLFQVASLSFVGPRGHALFHADENPGPDHLDFKLPAARGYVALYDRTGRELNRLAYTNAIEGVSLGRLPDGNTNLVAFPWSASPGTTNYLADYRGVLLNEVLARNVSAVTNAAGQPVDWIELFNPSAAAVDLAGMSLSVNVREPGQWVFPPGVTLDPERHLLVWCRDVRPASTQPEPELECGTSLGDAGGGVYLFNAGGQLVDAVEYGFQLPDRSFGRTANGWALLAQPTPAAPNADPAPVGDPLNVRLNEWLATSGQGDWLELYNLDPLPVNLAGLALTDDPSLGGQTNHLVGPLTFIAGQGWVKWQADGDVTRGRDHLAFGLDALGETLRLYTPSFAIVDTVSLLVQDVGVSEGRFPDGGTNIVRFPGIASPGLANYLPLETVRINEVLAAATPPLEAAIELQNATARSVPIGGWWLSDDLAKVRKFRIPDGTALASRDFAVFYANQFDATPGSPTSLDLDPARGGLVVLSETDAAGELTGRRSVVRFGATEPGISVGRYPTSVGVDFVALRQRTFGADRPQSLAEFRTGAGLRNAAPQVGPVVINEIMYHPAVATGGGTVEDPDAEFIELANLSAAAADLFDPQHPTHPWRLSGGVEYAFPTGVSLPAGGFVLVVGFDPEKDVAALAAFRSRYRLDETVRVLGPSQGRLANEGEPLVLERPLAPLADAGYVPFTAVETVHYTPNLPWPPAANGTGRSLQRNRPGDYGGEPMNWHAGWPTPGLPNYGAGADEDNDGLPDDWELLQGLNPENPTGNDGAEGDPDADGIPNHLEYALGTNPHEIDVALTGIRVEANAVYVSFNVIAGRTYAVEFREVFGEGDWRFLTNILPSASNQIVEVRFLLAANTNSRYYRVRIQ